MPNWVLSEPHRSLQLNATLSYLDSGSGVARLRFYTGTQPASPLDSTSEVLLAEQALLKPCGYVSAGKLYLITDVPSVIAVTGTCGWVRVVNGDGVGAQDGTVSLLTGTGAIRMNTLSFVAGKPLQIRSAILR